MLPGTYVLNYITGFNQEEPWFPQARTIGSINHILLLWAKVSKTPDSKGPLSRMNYLSPHGVVVDSAGTLEMCDLKEDTVGSQPRPS